MSQLTFALKEFTSHSVSEPIRIRSSTILRTNEKQKRRTARAVKQVLLGRQPEA